MPMPSRACSRFLLLGAILAFVLVPSSGNVILAAGAPTAAPATHQRLTPELWQKMQQLNTAQGTDNDVSTKIANALGMTATGQGWPGHRFGALEHVNDSNLSQRIYVVSRGADQDVLLTRGTAGVLFVYRIHRDGTLVAALSLNRETKEITMRNPAEAEADLEGEFAFWAANVDHLLEVKK
jgi:hypothetical protein